MGRQASGTFNLRRPFRRESERRLTRSPKYLWMNGSCLHSEDWAATVLYKLVYDGLGIIVVTIFQTGKAAHTDKVAEATHHRDSLQQVLALVAIHDNATLCLHLLKSTNAYY